MQCGALPIPVKAPTPEPFGEGCANFAARPKPLPTLYETSHTASLVQSQVWRYFAECERLSKMPKIPNFLLSSDGTGVNNKGLVETTNSLNSSKQDNHDILDISVQAEQMIDSDLLTLTEPLRAVSTSP